MTDWRNRHPFKIGDRVEPRGMQLHGIAPTVTMRGEDEYGPWIVVDDGWLRLDANQYQLAADVVPK